MHTCVMGRVVRLLCCVATGFILFLKVSRIFDATVQKIRLKAFKKDGSHLRFSEPTGLWNLVSYVRLNCACVRL